MMSPSASSAKAHCSVHFAGALHRNASCRRLRSASNRPRIWRSGAWRLSSAGSGARKPKSGVKLSSRLFGPYAALGTVRHRHPCGRAVVPQRPPRLPACPRPVRTAPHGTIADIQIGKTSAVANHPLSEASDPARDHSAGTTLLETAAIGADPRGGPTASWGGA
jgi:hypothetical protein